METPPGMILNEGVKNNIFKKMGLSYYAVGLPLAVLIKAGMRMLKVVFSLLTAFSGVNS